LLLLLFIFVFLEEFIR